MEGAVNARRCRVGDDPRLALQQHHRLRLEYRRYMANSDGDNLVLRGRARKFAGHRIQRLSTHLAMLRDARLQAYARGEIADQQTRGQHDDEGQQIL